MINWTHEMIGNWSERNFPDATEKEEVKRTLALRRVLKSQYRWSEIVSRDYEKAISDIYDTLAEYYISSCIRMCRFGAPDALLALRIIERMAEYKAVKQLVDAKMQNYVNRRFKKGEDR